MGSSIQVTCRPNVWNFCHHNRQLSKETFAMLQSVSAQATVSVNASYNQCKHKLHSVLVQVAVSVSISYSQC